VTITDITRTAVVDQLLLAGRPFHGRMDLVAFLKRVWDLSSMPSTDFRFKDAAGDIWQHMVNNSDWSYDHLLYQRLDILSCEDKTFLRFLETCLHPLAVTNDAEAHLLAAQLNALVEKDGCSLVVTERISDRAIYRAVELSTGASGSDPEVFEVVLSFAGEDRAYVEEVARILRDADVSCFYDQYEEVTLWGKDLVEHLDKVYRSARFCVMFISRHYSEKLWPNHERKSALAKAVQEKGEYILPARFDDTDVPGVRHTIGYVDLRRKEPHVLAEMILRKLGHGV
jgi:hypothetical protein